MHKKETGIKILLLLCCLALPPWAGNFNNIPVQYVIIELLKDVIKLSFFIMMSTLNDLLQSTCHLLYDFHSLFVEYLDILLRDSSFARM